MDEIAQHIYNCMYKNKKQFRCNDNLKTKVLKN